jgi:hypothetical protein
LVHLFGRLVSANVSSLSHTPILDWTRYDSHERIWMYGEMVLEGGSRFLLSGGCGSSLSLGSSNSVVTLGRNSTIDLNFFCPRFAFPTLSGSISLGANAVMRGNLSLNITLPPQSLLSLQDDALLYFHNSSQFSLGDSTHLTVEHLVTLTLESGSSLTTDPHLSCRVTLDTVISQSVHLTTTTSIPGVSCVSGIGEKKKNSEREKPNIRPAHPHG